MEIQEILNSEDIKAQKALFCFDGSNTEDQVVFKFGIWGRHLFPKYFKSKDAKFHHDINVLNYRVYRGVELEQFVNIAFRGAGKDVKTKLFIAFVILNDMEHSRKYFKVLAEDGDNSKQSVTDIYNMLVNPNVTRMYPETFAKTVYKREETMGSFTTATNIKVVADTVGTEQRGAIQEETRPDFIWFNDFETRKTLRSTVITKAIWDNMEEARTGLEKGGGSVYTCNYISELGNVHKLVTEKLSARKHILIIPIWIGGVPVWDRYTVADIEHMKATDDDFEGERECKPSASKDILFDREKLETMVAKVPVKTTADFRIYKLFNPGHRYGSGHDVAGGVGLDSSASVFINFSVIPAEVVATFASNTVKPEDFGDEIFRETEMFGGNLAAIENNKFDMTVLKAKQHEVNLFAYKKGKATQVRSTNTTKDYGWNTNSLTKPKMFFGLQKAVNDGLLILNDPALIKEAKSYSRNDLMDKEEDPRDITNTTRHFDLLTACAIAWQMKDFAEESSEEEEEIIDEDEPLYPDIGV